MEIYKKEYLEPEYLKGILNELNLLVDNRFSGQARINMILFPEAKKSIETLEKIKKCNCLELKSKLEELRKRWEASNRRNTIPDLDNGQEVEQRLHEFCQAYINPRYTGFQFNYSDIEKLVKVGGYKFKILPKEPEIESRVVIYDIITKENIGGGAWASMGGVLHPQSSTERLHIKNNYLKNLENVAKVHLVYDAFKLGSELHKHGTGHKKLGKMFKVPEIYRY